MEKNTPLYKWCKADPRPVAEQAQFLGLSEPQYWRIRKGGKTSVDTAMRIEKLTGVKASALLGLERA